MEVMAYSQYFIQHKALSSTLSSTITTSNVISSTLKIWSNCIYSTVSKNPNIKVTLNADSKIDLVLLTPMDQYAGITAW